VSRARAPIAPAIALAVALGVGVPMAAAATDPDPERANQLEDAIGEAGEAELAALAELEVARVARADAEAELTRIDARLADAEVALADAEDLADLAAGDYYDLYYRVEDGKAAVRATRRGARGAMAEWYVSRGSDVGWSVVDEFAAGDFSDAGARSIYLEQVGSLRREQLADAEQSLAALEALTAEAEDLRALADDAVDVAEARRADVVELRQAVADRRADLARAEADEADVLERIRARKAEFEQELARITAESGSIGQMLAARQAAQPRGTLEVTRPVPGPVVSVFGPRLHPILGYVRLHMGVDMDGDLGDPIVAAADGVVAWADVRGGYGNCVIIDHGNQFATLYAHQSQFAVGIGDRVRAGQVIGFVGSTGLSSGPHLHFEVRDLGIPVDPEPYLVSR
jgi:murein DD-endopeptidase MepM/ murein hydrolase activator NlpD